MIRMTRRTAAETDDGTRSQTESWCVKGIKRKVNTMRHLGNGRDDGEIQGFIHPPMNRNLRLSQKVLSEKACANNCSPLFVSAALNGDTRNATSISGLTREQSSRWYVATTVATREKP